MHALLLTTLIHTLLGADEDPQKWSFRVRPLALDANEGVAIADFDGDGRLDVAAGRNWYPAPDFIGRPLRAIEDWNGYVQSNGDFAFDVNRDGWMDIVAGSFQPTEVRWFENPGPKRLGMGHQFLPHLLVDTGYSDNEGSMMHDIDGDGVVEWITNSYRNDNPLLVWRFEWSVEGEKGTPRLVPHEIGPSGNGHGMAFGDLNADGREDILVGTGWYERPEGHPLENAWIYHRFEHAMHTSVPCVIRDVDGDGRNDVLWGNGHNYGLYWWESDGLDDAGEPKWTRHVIDESFSQPHCLHMADLDGDGTDELITGKRVFAHNGHDPGGHEPPVLYAYRWNGESKSFERMSLDDSGRVGCGLQIRTADLDGDGDLDIAVAGKSGTYLLFNEISE